MEAAKMQASLLQLQKEKEAAILPTESPSNIKPSSDSLSSHDGRSFASASVTQQSTEATSATSAAHASTPRPFSSFQPFAKTPGKQKRYEQYLDCIHLKKPCQ